LLLGVTMWRVGRFFQLISSYLQCSSSFLIITFELSWVSDPHYVNADPDPSFHINANPDSAFHFNADPDPAFY
jgi:hypothetical protein